MKVFKRLTASGFKRRRTTRINQVKKKVSGLNIGATDKGHLVDLLSQKVHTKRGVARSKRLQSLIFSDEIKGLKRFKEFRSINIKTPESKLKSIVRQLQSDVGFYNHNLDLIESYNKLSKSQKRNKRLKIVQAMDREYAAFLKSENII